MRTREREIITTEKGDRDRSPLLCHSLSSLPLILQILPDFMQAVLQRRQRPPPWDRQRLTAQGLSHNSATQPTKENLYETATRMDHRSRDRVSARCRPWPGGSQGDSLQRYVCRNLPRHPDGPFSARQSRWSGGCVEYGRGDRRARKTHRSDCC